MTRPNPGRHEPDTDCPHWCDQHIDGRHVGALTLYNSVNGFNIYTRDTDYGDGDVGMELVVAQIDGDVTARVQLTPDDIAQHNLSAHAMESDLRNLLATIENGTATDDSGGHPTA